MKVHLHTINSRLRTSFKSKFSYNEPIHSPENENFFAFLDSGSEDDTPYLDRWMVAFDPADPRLQDEQIIYGRKGDDGEELLTIPVSEAAKQMESRQEQLTKSLKAPRKAMTGSTSPMTIASRIWVAMALLHKENPSEVGFAANSIRKKLAELFYDGDLGRLEAGIPIHLSGHLVAEAPRHGVNKCYLTSVRRGIRRLYKPGDPCDPSREGADIHPSRSELTPEWYELLDWYTREYATPSAKEG